MVRGVCNPLLPFLVTVVAAFLFELGSSHAQTVEGELLRQDILFSTEAHKASVGAFDPLDNTFVAPNESQSSSTATPSFPVGHIGGVVFNMSSRVYAWNLRVSTPPNTRGGTLDTLPDGKEDFYFSDAENHVIYHASHRWVAGESGIEIVCGQYGNSGFVDDADPLKAKLHKPRCLAMRGRVLLFPATHQHAVRSCVVVGGGGEAGGNSGFLGGGIQGGIEFQPGVGTVAGRQNMPGITDGPNLNGALFDEPISVALDPHEVAAGDVVDPSSPRNSHIEKVFVLERGGGSSNTKKSQLRVIAQNFTMTVLSDLPGSPEGLTVSSRYKGTVYISDVSGQQLWRIRYDVDLFSSTLQQHGSVGAVPPPPLSPFSGSVSIQRLVLSLREAFPSVVELPDGTLVVVAAKRLPDTTQQNMTNAQLYRINPSQPDTWSLFAGASSSSASSSSGETTTPPVSHSDPLQVPFSTGASMSVTLDQSGRNIVIADDQVNVIRRISFLKTQRVVAGVLNRPVTSGSGFDADPKQAMWNRAVAVAVHPRTQHVYIADSAQHRIFSLCCSPNSGSGHQDPQMPFQTLNVVAGSGLQGDIAHSDPLEARFNSPSSLAFTADDDLLVGEQVGESLKLVVLGGVRRTRKYSSDAIANSPTGSGVIKVVGRSQDLAFNSSIPFLSGGVCDVAVDHFSGNIFLVECLSYGVRMVKASLNRTELYAGHSSDNSYVDSADRLKARFGSVSAIAASNKAPAVLYVGEKVNSRIRKIHPSGGVTTLLNIPTRRDAILSLAEFTDGSLLLAVAQTKDVLYLSFPFLNSHQRTSTIAQASAGDMNIFAGSGGTGGSTSDDALDAEKVALGAPLDLAVDRKGGSVFVADLTAAVVRKITVPFAVEESFDFSPLPTFDATRLTPPCSYSHDSSIDDSVLVSAIAGGVSGTFDNPDGSKVRFSNPVSIIPGSSIPSTSPFAPAFHFRYLLSEQATSGRIRLTHYLDGATTSIFAGGVLSNSPFHMPSHLLFHAKDDLLFVFDTVGIHVVGSVDPSAASKWLVVTHTLPFPSRQEVSAVWKAFSGCTHSITGEMFAVGKSQVVRYFFSSSSPAFAASGGGGRGGRGGKSVTKRNWTTEEGLQAELFAGNGTVGYLDSATNKLAGALFGDLMSCAIWPQADAIYLSDFLNGCIRKIVGSSVSTVVGGNAIDWSLPNASRYVLDGPRGLALDPAGNLFITSSGTHQILTFSVVEDSAVNGFGGGGGDGVQRGLLQSFRPLVGIANQSRSSKFSFLSALPASHTELISPAAVSWDQSLQQLVFTDSKSFAVFSMPWKIEKSCATAPSPPTPPPSTPAENFIPPFDLPLIQPTKIFLIGKYDVAVHGTTSEPKVNLTIVLSTGLVVTFPSSSAQRLAPIVDQGALVFQWEVGSERMYRGVDEVERVIIGREDPSEPGTKGLHGLEVILVNATGIVIRRTVLGEQNKTTVGNSGNNNSTPSEPFHIDVSREVFSIHPLDAPNMLPLVLYVIPGMDGSRSKLEANCNGMGGGGGLQLPEIHSLWEARAIAALNLKYVAAMFGNREVYVHSGARKTKNATTGVWEWEGGGPVSSSSHSSSANHTTTPFVAWPIGSSANATCLPGMYCFDWFAAKNGVPDLYGTTDSFGGLRLLELPAGNRSLAEESTFPMAMKEVQAKHGSRNVERAFFAVCQYPSRFGNYSHGWMRVDGRDGHLSATPTLRNVGGDNSSLTSTVEPGTDVSKRTTTMREDTGQRSEEGNGSRSITANKMDAADNASHSITAQDDDAAQPTISKSMGPGGQNASNISATDDANNSNTSAPAPTLETNSPIATAPSGPAVPAVVAPPTPPAMNSGQTTAATVLSSLTTTASAASPDQGLGELQMLVSMSLDSCMPQEVQQSAADMTWMLFPYQFETVASGALLATLSTIAGTALLHFLACLWLVRRSYHRHPAAAPTPSLLSMLRDKGASIWFPAVQIKLFFLAYQGLALEASFILIQQKSLFVHHEGVDVAGGDIFVAILVLFLLIGLPLGILWHVHRGVRHSHEELAKVSNHIEHSVLTEADMVAQCKLRLQVLHRTDLSHFMLYRFYARGAVVEHEIVRKLVVPQGFWVLGPLRSVSPVFAWTQFEANLKYALLPLLRALVNGFFVPIPMASCTMKLVVLAGIPLLYILGILVTRVHRVPLAMTLQVVTSSVVAIFLLLAAAGATAAISAMTPVFLLLNTVCTVGSVAQCVLMVADKDWKKKEVAYLQDELDVRAEVYQLRAERRGEREGVAASRSPTVEGGASHPLNAPTAGAALRVPFLSSHEQQPGWDTHEHQRDPNPPVTAAPRNPLAHAHAAEQQEESTLQFRPNAAEALRSQQRQQSQASHHQQPPSPQPQRPYWADPAKYRRKYFYEKTGDQEFVMKGQLYY